MQNSQATLSFGDFLAVNYTSQPDELMAWYAKGRQMNEDVSKRANELTTAADSASDSAQGAAGSDLSKHPAVDAHAKAYDAHRIAARSHAMDHRKTGHANSEKKAKHHREMRNYHKDHLIALGAIKEDVELDEEKSNNPEHGYHGENPSGYSATHAKVKKIAGEAGHLQNAKKPNVMVRHYLDSAHGRHLRGHEHDHEHITKDFGKFAKHYDSSLHEDLNEEGLVYDFSHMKQPPIAKKVEKKSKVVNNDPEKHCPHCAALGKTHHILNHLREQVARESIEEAASPHPKHTVSISYDRPNHEIKSERFTSQHVDVKVHAASKEEAIAKAQEHIKKKGHRVLYAHHIGTS